MSLVRLDRYAREREQRRARVALGNSIGFGYEAEVNLLDSSGNLRAPISRVLTVCPGCARQHITNTPDEMCPPCVMRTGRTHLDHTPRALPNHRLLPRERKMAA